jgi:hypothetical protein
LDKRAKSVATSAQRVVADMHRDLDLQRKKVTELESLVGRLTDLCTESLENEIFRLELKRKELLLELQTTDEAILDRQRRLEAAKDGVRGLLMRSDQGTHIAEQVASVSSSNRTSNNNGSTGTGHGGTDHKNGSTRSHTHTRTPSKHANSRIRSASGGSTRYAARTVEGCMHHCDVYVCASILCVCLHVCLYVFLHVELYIHVRHVFLIGTALILILTPPSPTPTAAASTQ